jgi:hypothetical protein
MEIQKRLARLIAEIEAGGKEGIANALTLANQYLAQQQPNVQPLTAQHFSGAKFLAKGNSSVTFARVRDDCMVDLFAVNYRSDRDPEVRTVTTRRAGFEGLLKNLDSRTCN